jgi:hypothetical protein
VVRSVEAMIAPGAADRHDFEAVETAVRRRALSVAARAPVYAIRVPIRRSATIERATQRDTDKTPSEFAARVEHEATRHAFERAARRAVLGDGAKWIWNLAKQHLSDVAKDIGGAASAEHKSWAKLDAGNIDAVLAALAPHVDAVKEVPEYADYVRTNRHRMRYADFHAA